MSFHELQKIAGNSGNLSAARTTEGRNVVLRVTGYDLQRNETIGINLATNAEERISLRDDKNAGSHARADVPAWSGNGKGGTRNKSYTEIGGAILFENVFQYPQGFTARWGTSVSHTPTEATVFIDVASLSIANSGAFCLDIIHTKAARVVSTLDELKTALLAALSENKYTAAIVRFEHTDEAGTTSHIVARDDMGRIVSRSIKVDGQFKNIEAAEAVEIFLSTKLGELLRTNIGKDFATEVIPVERIFAGKDTQEKLSKKSRDPLSFYKSEHGVGYTETIITFRRHPEGGKYFSAEPIPTSTKPALYAMDFVATKNMQPQCKPKTPDLNLDKEEPKPSILPEPPKAHAEQNTPPVPPRVKGFTKR